MTFERNLYTADSSGRAPSLNAARTLLNLSARWAREPLLHFLAAGLVLFCGGQIYRQYTSPYRIEISQERETQLAQKYALQFGTAPDAATLRTLVDQDIHEEILFQEGLRFKLDQGDEIVRRRIVQKAQFLLQDIQAPAEPTETELRAYFAGHASDYGVPEHATFSHIYFSADHGDDDAARSRAVALRDRLAGDRSRGPEMGDPFPDLYDFSGYDPDEVARLFGHTEFSTAVMSISPGHWAGPFRSSYGWHLIYVQAREPARTLPFSEARIRVREDYLRDAQHQANEIAFAKMAAKYQVVRKASEQQ